MTAGPAGTTRYAGRRIHRVEDQRLLTGRGRYVDDVFLAGMLHACFVRSPLPRARILNIDTDEAQALPGVFAVFTALDINPGVHEQWNTMHTRHSPQTPRPPLAHGEVRFVGDPVALVVADNRYIAEDACDLVYVDYDPMPPVVDYLAAEEADQLVHADHGSNVIAQSSGPPADPVEDAFSSAVHVVSDRIFQQAQAATPMETRGIVVDYSAPTGEITIYAATQAPHEVRAFSARLLGIPENRVRVVAGDTGGGFGQKVMVTREDMAMVLASLKVPAPIKWIEDRRENLMCAGQSRHESADVKMAFDADGLIQAARIDYIEDCGAYPISWPGGTAMVVGALFPGPYRVPRATFTAKSMYTNTSGRSAYRGPWVFETVSREMLLDQAARQIGIDPFELRRRNLIRIEDQPYANPNGMVFDYISPLETFEQAAGILGYDEFRRHQSEARESGRYLGVGSCTYVEPTSPGQGMLGTEGATIRIEPSGRINVYMSGGAAGNSVETSAVQLVADALGADMADITASFGDTASAPFGGGTAGSRSGSMVAGAVEVTASDLRARIISIAAHRLEAAPEDIQLSASRAGVRGTPAKSLSFAEIAELAYFSPERLPEGVPAGLEVTGRYKAAIRSNWANATHVCTCEVDTTTGRVELLRHIVSEDCGPMINPNIVEGQIAGGTVQGIAGALYEHLAIDDDGNPVATTFMDYLVPTTTEIPTIEYGHFLDRPGPGPGGYKGVGEGGVLGAVGAVVNAVADALAPLGVKVSRLPLSPGTILALIEEAGH